MYKRSYRRRTGGIRQKPWNKVPRIQKFWVPDARMRTANEMMSLDANAMSAAYIQFWDPFIQNTEGVAAFNFTGPGFSGVKVHRIQGHIKLYGISQQSVPTITANRVDSDPPFPPPMAVVDYAWMLLDKAADTHDAGSFPATNMDPSLAQTGDMFEILQRDDVLRWGSVDVQCVRPQALESGQNGISLTPMMGYLPYRSSIPFPRIGKFGLNIPRGKALACLAAARCLPDGWGGLSIDDGADAKPTVRVIVEPVMRLLCSA